MVLEEGGQRVGAPVQLKDARVRDVFGENVIVSSGETGRIGQVEHV